MTKKKKNLKSKIESKKLNGGNSNQIKKNKSQMHLLSNNQKKSLRVKTQEISEVSIDKKDLINLGIDIWRMKQRINKIIQNIPENSQDLLRNSLQKITRYLEKNDIEIIDYTNQKFNEGRNVDVLAVEKSSNILESIIKETKEPTILYKNQVVNKGKVIVLEKNNEDVVDE